jgi:hypothetical protein
LITEHHRRTIYRAGGEGENVIDRWYAGPTVIEFRHRHLVRRANSAEKSITTGSLPAVTVTTHHYRKITNGAKSVGDEGFGAGGD